MFCAANVKEMTHFFDLAISKEFWGCESELDKNNTATVA
jgi:hypothetical protein